MHLSRIEKFLAVRILAVFVIAAACDLLFVKPKLAVLAGFACGTALSLFKLRSTAVMYARLFGIAGKSSTVPATVMKFLFNIVVTLVVLLVAVEAGTVFFLGVTAGVLLLPAVVFVNGITESIGLTHNNFE